MRHENSWKIEEEVSINKRQDKSDSAGAAIAGLVKFKNKLTRQHKVWDTLSAS